MANELVEVLKRFYVSSSERVEIDLNIRDANVGMEECRKCLLCKMIGEKVINAVRIKSFVNYMDGYTKNMNVMELGVTLYKFSFSDEQDINKIIMERPYIIESQLLNIKEWEEDIDQDPKDFLTSLMWVQLWNMLIHWLTTEVGKKLASTIGTIEDVSLLI